MAAIGPGRNCAASSISPITFSPRLRAWTSCGASIGDAGADDDQILLAEGAVAVAAGFDGDAVFEEEENFLAEFGFGLGVGDGDAGATGL